MNNVTQSVTHEYAEIAEHGDDFVIDIDPADFERQCKLEEEMNSLGAADYWNNVHKANAAGQASSTKAGSFMLNQLLERTVEGLRKWLADVEAGRPQNRPAAYKYIRASSPEVVAFIALRLVIDKVTIDVTTTSMASTIGRALEDEARLRDYRDELPAYYDAVKKSLDKKTSNMQHQRRVLKGALETKIEESFEPWANKSIIHVGLAMLGIVIEATGIVCIQQERSRGKTISKVRATEKSVELMGRINDMSSLMCPYRLPAIIPPKPWTNPNNGGYWTPNVRVDTGRLTCGSAWSSLPIVTMSQT